MAQLKNELDPEFWVYFAAYLLQAALDSEEFIEGASAERVLAVESACEVLR